MTVVSSDRSVNYTGNGSATTFDYGFKIYVASHVVVSLLEIATGDVTVLTDSQYSITGVGYTGTGGTVTYPLVGSPLASTHKIFIERTVPYTQQQAISNQAGYRPETVERSLDLLTMQVQQLSESSENRTLRVPSYETAIDTIPNATDRADSLLGFDTSGQPVATSATGVLPGSLTEVELEASFAASLARVSKLNEFETTVHRLVGFSDPADVTHARLTAALTANPTVQVLKFLDYDYALSSKLAIANRDMLVVGAGAGATLIDFNGATGGFGFTDASTGLATGKAFAAGGMTLRTNQTGFRGFDARWVPRPFFFDGQMTTFEDLNFITADIEAAQAWDDMIYCENAQGFSASRVDGSNRRDFESGKGIRLKTCLGGARVNDININYLDDTVYCEPTAFSIVSYTGQTVNFTDGDIITSSGGAVGRLMRTLSDAGTTGDLAIIPISGAFTIGHSITGALGGNGTIGAVDNTRWWAGESLTVDGMEGVGVKRGINVYNPNSVYQKFVGVFLSNVHANGKEYAINLEYCSQVEASNNLLYLLANNAIGMRLVGVDKWKVQGRVENPGAFTGTVGIVISVGVAGFGTNTSDDGTRDLTFSNVATEVSLDPAATNIYSVRREREDASDWVQWVPTVSAQTPGGTPPTFGTVTAYYQKIGRTLKGEVRIAITAAGTGTNALQATLPAGVTVKRMAVGIAHANTLTGNSGTVKIATPGGDVLQAVQYNGSSFIASGADVMMFFECEVT